MQKTTQKHLTLEDRNYIEQALNQNMSFAEIAKFLSKDPITISKEVEKHRTRKEHSGFKGYNLYAKQFTCTKKNVCGKNCHTLCHGCRVCPHHCPDYKAELMKILKNI